MAAVPRACLIWSAARRVSWRLACRPISSCCRSKFNDVEHRDVVLHLGTDPLHDVILGGGGDLPHARGRRRIIVAGAECAGRASSPIVPMLHAAARGVGERT